MVKSVLWDDYVIVNHITVIKQPLVNSKKRVGQRHGFRRGLLSKSKFGYLMVVSTVRAHLGEIRLYPTMASLFTHVILDWSSTKTGN